MDITTRNVPRQDVLDRFHLSPSGLHKVVKEERFSPPFYVGAKPLWREADLAAIEAGHWTPAMQAQADQAAQFANSPSGRQAADLANSPAARQAAALANSPGVQTASRIAEQATAPRRGRRAAL